MAEETLPKRARAAKPRAGGGAKKRTAPRAAATPESAPGPSVAARVRDALGRLEALGRPAVRDGMARYGITAEKAYGVPMGGIHRVAKEIGRDHALVEGLWASGWYEARLLVSFVGEPEVL